MSISITVCKHEHYYKNTTTPCRNHAEFEDHDQNGLI